MKRWWDPTRIMEVDSMVNMEPARLDELRATIALLVFVAGWGLAVFLLGWLWGLSLGWAAALPPAAVAWRFARTTAVLFWIGLIGTAGALIVILT